MWKIRSTTKLDNHKKPKYWSREVGWTWKDTSDSYTTEEKEAMYTPVGGVWEEQQNE
jgi:hypothetical protein